MDANLSDQLAELAAKATNPETVAADEEAFRRIRADTRGALIMAHHALNPHEWLISDDRMLDLVTAWIDNLRTR